MSELENDSEESKRLEIDLWDKITDGAQYIQDHNLGKHLPSEPLSDKEIYDQIIKVSESIPHLEPVQPFIVGGALFSTLKSAPDFTQDDAPNIAATITAMLGSITIICDGFIQNDDPNIYQFVDNKLTIVATVTGLDV